MKITHGNKTILCALAGKSVYLQHKAFTNWWQFSDNPKRVKDKTIYQLLSLGLIKTIRNKKGTIAVITDLGRGIIKVEEFGDTLSEA